MTMIIIVMEITRYHVDCCVARSTGLEEGMGEAGACLCVCIWKCVSADSSIAMKRMQIHTPNHIHISDVLFVQEKEERSKKNKRGTTSLSCFYLGPAFIYGWCGDRNYQSTTHSSENITF